MPLSSTRARSQPSGLREEDAQRPQASTWLNKAKFLVLAVVDGNVHISTAFDLAMKYAVENEVIYGYVERTSYTY